MLTTRYRIPISELFKILEIDDSPLETAVTSPHKIKISTPGGFQPINGFVRKRHETARYYLENGESLSCSTKHIVFENNVPKIISECYSIDTVSGPVQLTDVEYLGEDIVYDVALDAPHQYVTPNGIIHHNTTLAKILIKAIDIDPYDLMEINASRENSVDTIRDKITNFVSTMPFGKFKIVLLDECLDEDTPIIVLRDGAEASIKIKDVNPSTDLVKSYNVDQHKVEWKTFELFDKGNQETLEIEFEDGSVVYCTPDHKWYVEENGTPKVVKASELEKYGHILTPA